MFRFARGGCDPEPMTPIAFLFDSMTACIWLSMPPKCRLIWPFAKTKFAPAVELITAMEGGVCEFLEPWAVTARLLRDVASHEQSALPR